MARFNPNLDYFRGISILLVVLFHYTSRIPAEALFSQGGETTTMFSFGWIGVYVFFIVSGFCISGSFDRSNSASQFMIKRIARIYPPFVVASIIIYVYQTLVYVPSFHEGDWSFSPSPVAFKDFFFTTFFMARDLGFDWVDGAYWTLLIEMKFYLYFSILGALGFLKKKFIFNMLLVYILPAIWAVSVVFEWGLLELILRNVFLAPYFPFFVLGITLASANENWNSRIPIALSTILIVFLIASTKPSPFERPLLTSVAYSALLLLLCMAIKHSETLHKVLEKMPPFKLLKVFGIYSFSWYLIHQKLGISIIFWLSTYINGTLSIAMSIGITFILAVLFSKLFEYRMKGSMQKVLNRILSSINMRRAI
jgi:peptidoglycan/LPS O-acetylase OafA/YrhL